MRRPSLSVDEHGALPAHMSLCQETPMKALTAFCICCLAMYACGSSQETRTIDPEEWEPPGPSQPRPLERAEPDSEDTNAGADEEAEEPVGPNPFVDSSSEPIAEGDEAQRIADAEREVLYWMNEARAEGGTCGDNPYPPARPLIWDDNLALAARRHSRDMAQHAFFSHTGFTGTTLRQRVIAAQYDDAEVLGENIAVALDDPYEAVQYLLTSNVHCANIRNPVFGRVGIGFVIDPDSEHGTYWTHVFAGTL